MLPNSHDVAEFFGLLQAPARGDGERHVHLVGGGHVADATTGELCVLLAHGGGDVGGREAELREAVRLQPDADRVVLGAEYLCYRHAGDAANLVHHVDERVVADEQLIAAAVRRLDADDQQDGGREFLDLHALAAHFLGQQGQGGLHAVVDVDDREVGVGAHGEGGREGHLATGAARGVRIQHVLHTVHALLERCGHGFREHVRARAGIDGGDLDGGRKDVRVQRDRQSVERAEAGDEDERRDDAGEDRPVDEEMRRHDQCAAGCPAGSELACSACGAAPGAPSCAAAGCTGS